MLKTSYVWTSREKLYIYIYVCVYVCVCVYILSTFIYIYICVCVYVCVCVWGRHFYPRLTTLQQGLSKTITDRIHHFKKGFINIFIEDLSPSLVVSRNLWLILFSKIWLFLNLVKHTSKNLCKSNDSKSALIFSVALVVVDFLSIFVMFRNIKVAEYIWDPCCHLVSETSSWFPLIGKVAFFKIHLHMFLYIHAWKQGQSIFKVCLHREY